MRILAFCFTVFVIIACSIFSNAGEIGNSYVMNETYTDESRCLGAPEIRGEKDNSISCFCRDAIIEARYVYQNYLITGKDENLDGVYLTLVDHAQQICGNKNDVYDATQDKEWRWGGPQVTREYPPESDILKIKPDDKGYRTVEYKVHLIYLDKAGRITKVEDFKASEKLPEIFNEHE